MTAIRHAASVEFYRLQHLPAFTDGYALLVVDIRIANGILCIDGGSVSNTIDQIRPYPAIAETPACLDVKCRKPVGMGFSSGRRVLLVWRPGHTAGFGELSENGFRGEPCQKARFPVQVGLVRIAGSRGKASKIECTMAFR
jgi:hypothetical protein